MFDANKFKFQHIAIEGVMNSGKTKLAEMLAKKTGAKAIFDRKDNPYLKEFYSL